MSALAPARLALFGLAVACLPAAARAQSNPRAEQLKAGADDALRGGDAVRALSFLDQAYALDPQPGILANRGLILDRLGDTDRALADFQAYLATNPPPEKRAPIETAIRRLQPEVVVASEPPGLTVTLDDAAAPLGVTPVRVTLKVGAHLVRFTGDAVEPGQLAFTVEPGREQAVQLHAVTRGGVAPLPSTPPAAESGGHRTWAYVALATGVAAAAAGGGLSVATLARRDERDQADERSRWESLDDQAERFEIGAGACFGVAVAAVGAGLYLWLSGD